MRDKTKVIMIAAALSLAFFAHRESASAEEAAATAPAQAAAGAQIYARNCSPCHGTRMMDPEGAFDLRKFPHDQHDRFVTSVTRGKGSMPPWGDLLKSEDVEALWAYVLTGGKN